MGIDVNAVAMNGYHEKSHGNVLDVNLLIGMYHDNKHTSLYFITTTRIND